jgi:hypothetical protein
MNIPLKRAAFAAAALFAVASARAEFHTYYIGIDDLPTLASGTYSGLANPNNNHLTFLYAHTYPDTPASNHYHSKGVFTYSGPAASPTVINSSSNYVPEGSAPPIGLTLGTGIHAGKLVSDVWGIGSTASLAGFAPGSGEDVLYNSSGGRWNSSFAAAHLHVEIVSLTAGLNIGNATTLSLGGAGTGLHLADPGESFLFSPVLWTDANAAPGVYEVSLRFFDEDGTFGDSGIIRLRTEVTAVPEPGSTAAAIIAGVVALVAVRRRHYRRR